MQKLWTQENAAEGIPLLGELLPAQSHHCQVALCQRITVPGAGHFISQKVLGLLDKRAMFNLGQHQEGSVSEDDCLGVALAGQPDAPIGQVSLSDGWYRYYLPVTHSLSLDRRWKTRGYLPLNNSKYIQVAHRSHAGRWTAAILSALLLGGVGYLIVIYGWDTVWRAVCATVNSWIIG